MANNVKVDTAASIIDEPINDLTDTKKNNKKTNPKRRASSIEDDTTDNEKCVSLKKIYKNNIITIDKDELVTRSKYGNGVLKNEVDKEWEQLLENLNEDNYNNPFLDELEKCIRFNGFENEELQIDENEYPLCELCDVTTTRSKPNIQNIDSLNKVVYTLEEEHYIRERTTEECNGYRCHKITNKFFTDVFVDNNCECYAKLNEEKKSVLNDMDEFIKENSGKDLAFVIEGKPGTGKSTLLEYIVKHTGIKCTFTAFKNQTLDSSKMKFMCCENIHFRIPSFSTIHAFIMRFMDFTNHEQRKDFMKMMNESGLDIYTLHDIVKISSSFSSNVMQNLNFLFGGKSFMVIIEEFFLVNSNLLYCLFKVCNDIRVKFNFKVKFLFVLVGSSTQCISIGGNTYDITLLHTLFGKETVKEYFLTDVKRTKNPILNNLINAMERKDDDNESKIATIYNFYSENCIIKKTLTIDICNFIEDYSRCLSKTFSNEDNMLESYLIFEKELKENIIVMCSQNIYCYHVLVKFFKKLYTNVFNYNIDVDKYLKAYSVNNVISTFLMVGMTYVITGPGTKDFNNRQKVRLLRIDTNERKELESVTVGTKDVNNMIKIIKLYPSCMEDFQCKENVFSFPIRPYFTQTIYQFQGETFDKNHCGYAVFKNGRTEYRPDYVFISRFEELESIKGITSITE